MPYATAADVAARYEQDTIDRLCWDRDTNAPVPAKLDRALEDAAAEIDSYLSTRYAVPVAPVPLILRNINVDLGLYNVALTADKMFEELTRRAENWRKHLSMISVGKAGLGSTKESTPEKPEEPSESTVGIFVKSIRV